MTVYDVVIVGRGVVGNTLAYALVKQGLQVAMIDIKPDIPLNLNQLDLRTFALTQASINIFKNLQLWSAMEAIRVSPFQQMAVWDAEGAGEIHFDCAHLHKPTLGYIVEQSVMLQTLQTALASQPTLTCYQPAKLQNFTITPDKNSMQINLESGEKLTTRLLVGAEGANSTVRTLAGIAYNLHDYGQQAIIANVNTEKSHQNTAWQRFLPTGPLAFLPLQDPHTCSIVWSTETPIAQNLVQMAAEDFQIALQHAFAQKLGAITAVSERQLFPLQRRHVKNYVQSRLALVGDAAHTIHPLAGQGVNLGLLDAACLAEIVLEQFKQHRDFGHQTVLNRYERWRKGHNNLMMWTMDGFKYLFSNRHPVLTGLRNVGLSVTNKATPVKHLIMEQAMGLKGDLPTLAKVDLHLLH